MRDRWQNKEYFEARITESVRLARKNYSEEKINKFKAVSPEKECNLISRSASDLNSIVNIKYANGNTQSDILETFELYLERLYEADNCYQHYRKSEYDNGSLWVNIDVVRTIVYGTCLRIGIEKLDRFAKCVQSGKDVFVDRLLSHYQSDRLVGKVLIDKGKYKQLIEILDSDDKAFQAKKLKNYLNQWPKKLGIRAPDGELPLHNTPTYDGYWCYEAAAVVIVCDIDDESFRDHEYYPSELMGWRKST